MKTRILLYLISFNLLFVNSIMAGNKPDDDEINRAVEVELLIQRGTYASMIDVETRKGIVTLSGTVDNILEKERSTQIAKAVKGVRGVANEVKIETMDIDNSTVEQNIRQAWLRDPATDSYELNVSVDIGHAFISGTVQSWQEKQLALKVAKGIRGIRSCSDHIEIKYSPSDRPDYEIKKEVEEALAWDIFLYDDAINVKVNNGKVKLMGNVGSASEIDMAEYDAWVAGVEHVDVENLNVAAWLNDEDLRDQKTTVKSDEEIQQAIKDVFLYDPRVFSFNPDVDVQDGVVTLTGRVDNLMAKAAAGKDARNVVGVFRVLNYLKVRPEDKFSDETIEQNVSWILWKDPYVNRDEVEVEVMNGVVFLSGDVDNHLQKIQAENAAARAKGVVSISNDLQVAPAWSFTEPWILSPYPMYTSNNKADWEILTDIEDQLWWSPFVNAEEVNVSVYDGNVKLTGTVDSWQERFAAEKNAFEGGAVTVNNQLNIENNGNDHVN